jgi:hypothetical protein
MNFPWECQYYSHARDIKKLPDISVSKGGGGIELFWTSIPDFTNFLYSDRFTRGWQMEIMMAIMILFRRMRINFVTFQLHRVLIR